MKLYHCGITIDVSAIEAPRYIAAGYVPVVEEKPVKDLADKSAVLPADPQPSLKGGRPEVVEEPKARISAKKKG